MATEKPFRLAKPSQWHRLAFHWQLLPRTALIKCLGNTKRTIAANGGRSFPVLPDPEKCDCLHSRRPGRPPHESKFDSLEPFEISSKLYAVFIYSMSFEST